MLYLLRQLYLVNQGKGQADLDQKKERMDKGHLEKRGKEEEMTMDQEDQLDLRDQ